jgi:hypothetical protein
MLQSTYDIAKDFGLPIALFVAGIIGSYGVAVYKGRAIRKDEFNKLIRPLYLRMKSQIDAGSSNIEDFNDVAIEPYISWYLKVSFQKSVKRYKQSKVGLSTYAPSTGKVTINESAKAEMLKSAKDVLQYITPR